MVQLVLSENKKKLGVIIGGKNFSELKNSLKENGFIFRKEGFSGKENLWVHTIDASLDESLRELFSISSFTIPEEIKSLINPEPETEYFRMIIQPEMLAVPPIGDYQTRAIKQGIHQSRCMFAHKQGLGKTYIAFSVLNHLWHYGKVDKCLILCRPEGVYNLKREILRFQTFGLSEEEIYIADSKNRTPFTDSSKVVICTYRTFLMLCDDAYKATHPSKGTKEIVRSDGYVVRQKEYTKKWLNPPIDFSSWGTGRVLFCDESHSLKNRQARWTRAVDLESEYFRFRYLMTGTPYPKNIEDLWEQFHIMDPNIIKKDYYSFLGDIAVLGTKFSQYAVRFYKEAQIEKFLDRVKPWIIREFATDNLNLPEQIEERIYVHLSDKQRAIYQEFVTYRMQVIKERGVDSKHFMKEVYNDFPRIQMAVTDPCLLKSRIEENTSPSLYKKLKGYKFEDSERVSVCDSLIEKHMEEGDKIILWSGHPDVMNSLAEHYKKYKPFVIHGQIEVPSGMSKDAYVDSILEEFKKDPERNLLIASYYMIATSKNITEAKVMIYYDRAWDWSVLDQSKERNHRPGSKFDNIIIYYLIGEKTIEERQDRVLTKRTFLDEEVLKYDSLPKEEWRKIFEGGDI